MSIATHATADLRAAADLSDEDVVARVRARDVSLFEQRADAR